MEGEKVRLGALLTISLTLLMATLAAWIVFLVSELFQFQGLAKLLGRIIPILIVASGISLVFTASLVIYRLRWGWVEY